MRTCLSDAFPPLWPPPLPKHEHDIAAPLRERLQIRAATLRAAALLQLRASPPATSGPSTETERQLRHAVIARPSPLALSDTRAHGIPHLHSPVSAPCPPESASSARRTLRPSTQVQPRSWLSSCRRRAQQADMQLRPR